jgi:hypothetical protein
MSLLTNLMRGFVLYTITVELAYKNWLRACDLLEILEALSELSRLYSRGKSDP